MNGSRMTGLRLTFRSYHFRIWRYGFEYGNLSQGRVVFFPWARFK